MESWQQRQTMLIGEEGTATLQNARVAVIGLGGVGGAALEALARCGVGHLLAMDGDRVEATNRNRQILALCSTERMPKSAVAEARVRDINPQCEVTARHERFSATNTVALLEFRPQYVIDAIDSVSDKLALIQLCKREGIGIISCMGTGNRLSANFVVGDIEDTAGCGCPLARVMRKELRARNLSKIPVVYSTVQPMETGQRTPASVAFVPPVAGYKLAEYIVERLLCLT